jgi:outer membrane protein
MKLVAAVTLAAAATVLAPAPAQAQADRWILKGRAFALVADDDSDTVGSTGTSITVANSYGAELAATYFPIPKWGLELTAAAAPLDLSTVGGQAPGLDLGSVDLLSAMLALQYHFQTDGKVNPYLGVGVAFGRLAGYSATDDLIGAGIADITFSNVFRLYTQAGADVEIGRGWLLNLDLRYVPMTTQLNLITAGGASFDKVALQINPILVSLGIGHSF